jgi:zinc protease
LLAAVVVASASLSAARAAVFNPRTITLANGLQVVVIENHRAPVVTHMVWYRVGAADEVRGKTGIAHFLEHVMFKGTKTVAPGAFSRGRAPRRQRERLHDRGLHGLFPVGLGRPSGRDDEARGRSHVNLVLTDEVVLPERDVIVEERATSRVDNDAGSQLMEMARARSSSTIPTAYRRSAGRTRCAA